MNNWQYREIEVRVGENNKGHAVWEYLNASTSSWQPFISDQMAFATGQRSTLNELGAAGWELVTTSEQVVQLPHGRNHFSRRYHLKRPA